ncbi:hypothetical protein FOA52_012826 [Chlamydomonas sp. UWO 241]|nr:hypothetical protein FOA52_012826 [Chlamydomonas sp. UWO 241]
MHSGFGVEACSALRLTNSGDGLLEAVSANVLDSGRIRVWKPRKPRKDLLYCYLVDDAESGQRDAFMQGKACDASSLLLKDVPFVRGVFADDGGALRTKYRSDNKKCVLAIDRAKIDEASLKQWWRVFADQDQCRATNMSLIERNEVLQRQYAQAVDDNDAAREDVATQEALVAALDRELADLVRESDSYEAERAEMAKRVAAAQAILTAIKTEAARKLALLANELGVLESSAAELDRRRAELASTEAATAKTMATVSEDLVLIRDKYASVSASVVQEQTLLASERESYETEAADDARCATDRHSTDRTLYDCRATNVETSSARAMVGAALQACVDGAAKCAQKLGLVTQRRVETKAQLAATVADVSTCLANVSACRDEVNDYRRKKDEETYQFEQTRVRLPHESCDGFGINADINDEHIRKTTELQADIDTIKNKADVIEKELQEMTDLKSCESAINQLRTNNKLITNHYIPCQGRDCNDQWCAQAGKNIYGNAGTYNGLYLINGNTRNACVFSYTGNDSFIDMTRRNNQGVLSSPSSVSLVAEDSLRRTLP